MEHMHYTLFTQLLAGADLGEGPGGPPLPPLNFEAQIFLVVATLMRDDGKISLAPTLTQMLDLHLSCTVSFYCIITLIASNGTF